MIPDWKGAIAASAKALAPEGHIHIVDFGDLKTMPGRGLLRHWLRLFHVTPREGLLQALEGKVGEVEEGLNVLPGRYAFRLKTSKGKLGAFFCGSAVTAER
jgi:S-adenosylmethionine-diacylgycerolhomoserine-N-methlytransferase